MQRCIEKHYHIWFFGLESFPYSKKVFAFLENYQNFLFWPSNESSSIESVNVQYNMLGHWVTGTNDSSTKRLMFQVLFFHNFLPIFLQNRYNLFFHFL